MTLTHQHDSPTLFGDDDMPERRIILMDLNVALSENFDQIRKHHMSTFVTQVETYRQWMVDLLRVETVALITARDVRWATPTLKRIHDQTGWTPQYAYFNDTGISGAQAHEVKRRLLREYVFPQFGPSMGQYLAIESNSRTREMYRSQQIHAVDCERTGQWAALPR